jgi:hypothetical protein
MLSVSPKMQPLRKVSKREEWESSTREYEPFKVPREALPTRAWSIYTPFPLLAVMSKTRTSRTVRDGLTDCPRLNSNGKKHEVKDCQSCPLHQAGRPPGPRGPSAWTSRAAHRSVWFEVNFRLSAVDPRRPEVIFSRKTLPKTSDFK